MEITKQLWDTAEQDFIPRDIPEYIKKDGVTLDQLSVKEIFEMSGDARTMYVTGLVLATRRIGDQIQVLYRHGDGSAHRLSCNVSELDDDHKVLVVGHEDSVGGIHECGCGQAPDGSDCGECSIPDCAICEVWTKKKAARHAGEGKHD